MRSKRRNLTPQQKERLMSMNAGVCCVCKTRGQGVNFHHIDGNSSNNDFENIAVLCVESHDASHRPQAYTQMKHLELGVQKILKYKREWEAFVIEAKKKNPKVLAAINFYGTKKSIHSLRLVFQTTNSQIVFERLYHLLTGSPESWVDSVIDEVRWLGPKIPVTMVDKPLPIEYCPCCGRSLANVIDSNVAKKITASNWERNSLCSVYINPSQPSLAIVLSYEKEVLLVGSLHKCGKYLHFVCDNFEERVPIKKAPSVKTQATRILSRVLDEWRPARTLIGTGDENNPEIIGNFNLPKIWENRK